jgi:hypothetical protein
MRMAWSLAAALAATPSICGMTALAAETWTGRWAADAAGCSSFGGSALVATDYALRWADISCRIGKSYKVGRSVHLQAHCWDGATNRDISVTLTTQQTSAGERLAMTWDNRAVKDMRRCQ